VKKSLPVIRRCISCRLKFDRSNLLKITKDKNLGILINKGIGRSAYSCKTEKCSKDSKFKKNLQKALKTTIDKKFYEIIAIEIQNYK
tara:strand:+ start:438 stop:698 length:261 start_codon:yes stop_codon:yes gene_type:complete